jgi:hypothetical protein
MIKQLGLFWSRPIHPLPPTATPLKTLHTYINRLHFLNFSKAVYTGQHMRSLTRINGISPPPKLKTRIFQTETQPCSHRDPPLCPPPTAPTGRQRVGARAQQQQQPSLCLGVERWGG